MKTKANKLLCLVMAMAMVFAFAACGGDSDAVKEYVNKNRSQLVAAFSSTGAGEYADCDVKANGTEIVIELKFKIDLNDEMLDRVDVMLDSMGGQMDSLLEMAKEEESAISKITYKILDKNGKSLGSVSSGQ